MPKKNTKKILQIQETIDQYNQKTRKVKISQLPREPEFVKLYIKDICAINDLKKNAYQVLLQCLYHMAYDGHITLLKYHREKIANAIGVTDQTVKNQLCLLTQKKILKRKSNMVYVANPDLFGRGYWDDIIKQREEYRLIVEYKNDTRTLKGRSTNDKYKALKFVD